MKKFIHYASYSILVLGYLLVGLIAFWLFYPYQTAKIVQPIPVMTQKVRNNETLPLVMDYCAYTNAPVDITLKFTDGVVYTSDVFHVSAASPKCAKVISTTYKVPETLPPGKYILTIVASYRVNPIRDIVKEFRTYPFEVIK